MYDFLQAVSFGPAMRIVKRIETFEKCTILVKIKKGENFNHRNILNILRIEI